MREFIDPYSEETVQEELLQSKPVSFLFVGKRKVGKTGCAKFLSSDWGAKLISEIALIENEIADSDSEYSAEIRERLENGKTISKNIVSALYLKALRSEAAEHYGIVIDGIPDIENEELIEEIKKKVNVVVNMKILDNELINSRTSMGYDPLTGNNISFLNENLVEQEDTAAGEEEEEIFDEEGEETPEVVHESFDAEKLVKTCGWVVIPEDVEPTLSESMKEYEEKYIKKIEDIITSVTYGYKGHLIELVSLMGYAQKDINHQLMEKLKALDLSRAMVPLLIKCDEEAPEELSTEELAENWIRKVRDVAKPATRFRWKRSKWGRYCPVALSSGYITTGLPNLSLAFLGKMYFFSSDQALNDFKINPRKYLIPSTPRNPIRIAVVGHPDSGKTTLANALADVYNCEIIRVDELVKDDLKAAADEALERSKAGVLELSIAMTQSEDAGKDTVDANDPRVKEKMDASLNSQEPKKVELPPSLYVERIKNKINEIEKKRTDAGDEHPFGRWILDGFPSTKDDWLAMNDADLIPGELIVVRDQTEKFEQIIEKHYQDNKDHFDREFTQRLKDEMKQKSEKEGSETTAEDAPAVSENRPLFSSPEFDKFRSEIGQFDVALGHLVSQAQQQANMNLFQLKYSYNKSDGMLQETIHSIESRFKLQSWPWLGLDQQEEEEDEANDDDGEEEDDEPAKPWHHKRLWGATSYYDPVLLNHTGVLIPGLPEVQAKYKEFTYAFQNTETMDVFIENPEKYVNPPGGPLEPPAMRFCVVGTRGCGKSSQVEKIAKENNTFHISFRDLIQEELLLITQDKKVGSEFTELNRLLEERELSKPEALQKALDGIVYPPLEADDEAAGPKTDGNGIVEEKEEEDEDEGDGEGETSDKEIAYKAFLNNNESIPHEFLDELIAPFWRSDKYKKSGFILEGFPSCSDDVRYMTGEGLFPDSSIIIECSEDDIIKRNLSKRINWFKEFHNLKEIRLRSIREKKQQVKKSFIEEQVKLQIEEQVAEAKVTDDESEGQGAGIMSEEEIRGNIEGNFNEDFLEVEDPHPELVDEAEERLKMEMSEEYSIQQEQINNITELLDEAQITRLNVDGSRKIYQVYDKTIKMIEPYLRPCRSSMFERVIAVSVAHSESLLRSNYLQLSSFGRWCPVSLKEGICFKPLDEDSANIFPLAYGPYLYFCYSQSARAKFIKAPLEYINNQNTTPAPQKALGIAIIGPPKSGKTTVAKRFAAELGLMKISPIDLVELLLSKYSKSLIAQQIQAELISGKTLSNDLLYAGLDLVLLDERCQTRGYVLDGIPSSIEEFDILQRRSIIPFRLIELKSSFEESTARNNKIIAEKIALKEQLEYARLLPKPIDDEAEEEIEEEEEEDEEEGRKKEKSTVYLIPIEEDYQATDNEPILKEHYQYYENEIDLLRKQYTHLYRNWLIIDAKQNRWKLWVSLYNFMSESIYKLQRYMDNIKNDKIAQLDGVCITPSEFEKRKSQLGDYCPVSLVLRNELVDCANQQDLRYCVEWKRKYYRVSGNREMAFILSDPEKYLNQTVMLPEHLPTSITAEVAHNWLKKHGEADIKGFCPVSFKDGDFSYESLVRGSENIAAIHMNKCYLFVSEEHKTKFMLHPHNYVDLVLPAKLPPKPVHIPFTSLPIGGYLEQGIASIFIDAIDAVGRKKPKFPFTTVTKSALLFVSIYLKANNPKMTDYTRNKWSEILGEFNSDCDNISFLGRKMTRRYRAPSQRLPELDTRLARFFNLQQKPEYARPVPKI